MINISNQTLSFEPLEGEEIKGQKSITHMNFWKIFKLLLLAIIFLYVQIYMWTSSITILNEFANYLLLIIFAIVLIITAIFEILNRFKGILYITNYRLVLEGCRDRLKTVVLKDYHYEFFESLELSSVAVTKSLAYKIFYLFITIITFGKICRPKKRISRITIIIVGFGKKKYKLPLELCTLIITESRQYLMQKS